MRRKDKSKSPRSIAMMLDILHIVNGIAVVVLAVLAFLNPEGYQFLFPFIFLLAAVLHGVNGIYWLRVSGRDKRKHFGSIVVLIVAVILFLFALFSAASIWR